MPPAVGLAAPGARGVAWRSAARGAGCWPVFTFCNAATAFQREGRGARGRPLLGCARRDAVCSMWPGRSAQAFQPPGRQLCPGCAPIGYRSISRRDGHDRRAVGSSPALAARAPRQCTAGVLNSSCCWALRLSLFPPRAATPRPSRGLGPLPHRGSANSAGFADKTTYLPWVSLCRYVVLFIS